MTTWSGSPFPDVDVGIRSRDAKKRERYDPIFGDEWPKTSIFPTRVVPAGQAVERAGLHFTSIDLGPGESISETVWLLDRLRPPIAFVGDLVFDAAHPYIGDGMTAQWLDALTRAQELLDPATILYTSHGTPVGHPTSVLQEQNYTGGARMPYLLDWGLDALAAELATNEV